MEKLQRIKLLMGYNSSKTLNENINELNIIIENNDNQTDIDEAGAGTVAKDLEAVLKNAGKDAEIAKSALVNSKAVLKDGKTFVTDLEQLSKAVKENNIAAAEVGRIRASMINTYEMASPMYKELSEQLSSSSAFYNKYKNLTDAQAIKELTPRYGAQKAADITNKFKSKVKSGFFKNIDSASTASTIAKDTKTGAKDAQTGAKDAQTGAKDANSNTANVSGKGNKVNQNIAGRDINITNNYISKGTKGVKEAGGKVATTTREVEENINTALKDEKLPPKTKETLQKNGEKLKNIKDQNGFISKAKRLFSKKWLVALGIIGGGYFFFKWLFGGNTSPELPEWSECMTDLLNNGGGNVSLKATKAGDPVVHVIKTERYPELDATGGVYFYQTGRVISLDGTKKGTWTCNSGEMDVETSDNAADTAPDEPVNENKILNEDALGNVAVVWDGEENTGGGGDNSGGEKKPRTPLYKPCEDFPFTIGCKSDKIIEVQKCLGMESGYQTGNFGPITKQTLIDKQINDGTKITQDDYNKIMSSCNGTQQTEPEKITVPPPPTAPKTEPIEPLAPRVEPTAPQTIPADVKPADIKPEESGQQMYEKFVQSGYFESGQIGDNRAKYKGPDLNQSELDKLNSHMRQNGYQFLKDKDKGDQYGDFEGEKYVWKKVR
jgi:hypothetical protein